MSVGWKRKKKRRKVECGGGGGISGDGCEVGTEVC